LSRTGLLRCYSAPRLQQKQQDAAEEWPRIPRCAEFGSDYTITLKKSGDKRVGISKAGEALKVNADPKSLLQEWNTADKNKARPAKHARESDLLIEVNGVSGDPDLMLEELKSATELKLKLRKVPKELGYVRKVNGELRSRLAQEELDVLDFHGASGDIHGLRAYLAHRRGCSARCWRQEIAPDEFGVQPATKGEFCRAMQHMGFPGQAYSLWHALSEGRARVGLEDLEPELAEMLDKTCKGLRKRFPGGAADAWQQLEREHLCRATFGEFMALVIERKMVPPASQGQQTIWRIFETLDVNGRGTITLEDLRFLDRWALHRYGVPLPVEEKAEE